MFITTASNVHIFAAVDEEDSISEQLENYYHFTSSLEQAFVGFDFIRNSLLNPVLQQVSNAYSLTSGLAAHLKDNDIYAAFYSSLVSPSRKCIVGKDSADIEYKLPTLSTVLIKAGENYNYKKGSDTANEATLKILKSIFPTFKEPAKVFGDAETTISRNLSNPEYTTTLTMEQLRKLKVPVDFGVKAFELDPEYAAEYPEFLAIQLTVKPNSIEFRNSRGYGNNSGLSSGVDIDDQANTLGQYENYNVEIPIEVKLVLRFPKDYANWTVGANLEGRKFIPALFLQFVNTHVNYFANDSKPAGGWPDRYLPLDLVAERSRKDAKKYPVLAKPRVNKEGFTILQDGDIMWIPSIDNTRSYVDALDLVNENTSFREAMRSTQLVDKPLLTDWVNGFVAFGNEDADIIYRDLQGSRPLDNVTIARYLHGKVNSDFFMGFLKVLADKIVPAFKVKNEAGDERALIDPNKPNIDENISRHIDRIRSFCSMHTDIHLWELLDPKHYMESDEFLDIREHLPFLKSACKQAFANLEKIPLGVTVRYGHYAFFLAEIGIYSDYSGDFVKSYAKAINDNKTLHFNPKQVAKVSVPGLPSLKSFLPHQVSGLFNLHMRDDQNGPPAFATLNVQAGGGKTLLTLADILMLLQGGYIKRPLVIAPGGLVKEWTIEINARSKGALNAFPLRTSTIDRMMEQFNWSEEDVIAYIRNMPINTILITDYKFLAGNSSRNRSVPIGTRNIVRFANAEIVQRIEPDYVALDESQTIKNIDTSNSKAARQVAATVKYVRELSGTMVHNTPRDYVGQIAAINPTILGNVRSFDEAFMDDTNNAGMVAGLSADIGRKLDDAFAPYFMNIKLGRREWAYLLPRIKETLHTVSLTERQQEFYNGLIDEAIKEILKDKLLKERMESGSDEDEAYILKKLEPHLAIAEQFVNAPGDNPAFGKIVGGNKSELVSPKVAMVNNLLTKHFETDDNKVLVFCYHKAVSKHIFENFAFQNKAVHYEAGDETAVLRFRNDPKVKILVADETSLQAGFNFQIASRMIRIQTLWTPGGQEQAIARIFRPDPDQKYARDEINFDWLVTNGSIETAKMARLISKTIANANAVEGNKNPSWNEIKGRFDSVPPFKLTLDNLRTFKYMSSLQPYYEAYGTYRTWEDKQNDYGRARLLADVEKAIGRKVETLQDLIKNAMIPVEHTKLEGSATAYTPFIEGATPVNPYGGELQAVALAEFDADSADDDDDEGTVVEVNAVNKGDVVYCELGVGIVSRVTRGTIHVDLGKLGTHTFNKTNVYVFKDDKVRDKLAKTLKSNPTSLHRTPKTMQNTNKRQLPPKVEEDVIKKVADEEENKPTTEKPAKSGKTVDEKPKEKVEEKPEADVVLELYPSTIMGGAALYIWNEMTANAEEYLLSRGFKQVPDAVYCRVQLAKGVDAFLEFCKKNKLEITSDRAAMLRTMAERMRGKGGKLTNTNRVDTTDIRNFLRSEHKVVDTGKHPRMIRPYPVVWEGDLYIFMTVMTNPKIVRKFRGVKLQGLTKFDLHGDVLIKFEPTKDAMLKELKEINSEATLTNYKQAVKEANAMKFIAQKIKKD